MSLLRNIRFYILSFNILLSIALYFYYRLTDPQSASEIIKLTESYALMAIFYLYLALLATPFTRFFTSFPWRGKYLKARRAIGVSAFYFAFLHANLAFFGQLDGFNGLGFLDGKYLLAIGLSTTALIILAAMASTSFDYMIDKLTFPRWKALHRFVYLAGVLILIHALMLGSHFSNLSDLIPMILFVALSFLFILESFRLDGFLRMKFPSWPSFGPSLGLVLIFIACYSLIIFFPAGNSLTSLGIHAQHIQLAQQAVTESQQPQAQNLPPSLVGDRTRRFTTSFLHPDQIGINQDTNLQFQVFDASSGNFINLFSNVYSKPMHLVVVDNELNFFNHIHPTQDENGFSITTQLPHGGIYHLYLNFQPLGAIEQQTAFTIQTTSPNPDQPTRATQPVDTNFTKTFGDYMVTLDFPKPLSASSMSIGGQKLTFTIKDKLGNPVTNLKPYLAAFGHLVMINEQSYDYLHVHPTNLESPAPDANGGPTVEFLPLGLYGPIKPGVYRIFAQFNPDGKLFTADFTINIE